ncbi:cytochrome b [Xanthobacteraceae bacterium A53D]
MANITHMGHLTQPASRNFNPVSKFFHWLMAGIIIAAWIIGYYGGSMLDYGVSDAETAQKVWAITLHKSIATTTLFLIAARLIWRYFQHPPALTDMPAIMKLATHLGHWTLYLLMIAVPVSGWANSSSAGYKIPVLGLFNIPQLGPKNTDLTPYLVEAHFYLAWALALVVIGHALFALKHHFIDKDETLTAMLPKAD